MGIDEAEAGCGVGSGKGVGGTGVGTGSALSGTAVSIGVWRGAVSREQAALRSDTTAARRERDMGPLRTKHAERVPLRRRCGRGRGAACLGRAGTASLRGGRCAADAAPG